MEQTINFFPHGIDKTFKNIVNELNKVQNFNISISNEDSLQIRKLVDNYKKMNPQPINYDKYWLDFYKQFFLKNLYKALVTIEYLKKYKIITSNTDLPIIDVGCGAGVCTIAWMSLFDKMNNKAILIDQNKFQLELAQHITKILKLNSLEFYNKTFPEEFNKLDGIRLYSYWFCEQKNFSIFLNADNISKIIGEGALIIDYQYIINRLQNVMNSNFSFTRWILKIDKIPEILVENNNKGQCIYGAYIKP
ncbi:MAG: class I SAM-dependent methyltransferase [Candidatus Omnitrophica bacterium]|nr:class I SAM-dependent methyltransferase [Candidatus Omnitrophota bacterium]